MPVQIAKPRRKRNLDSRWTCAGEIPTTPFWFSSSSLFSLRPSIIPLSFINPCFFPSFLPLLLRPSIFFRPLSLPLPTPTSTYTHTPRPARAVDSLRPSHEWGGPPTWSSMRVTAGVLTCRIALTGGGTESRIKGKKRFQSLLGRR